MVENESQLKTVRCRNPKNGVVYVYSYSSYYDASQQKYRQQRRCIGKIDPETGLMVDTLPRGAPRKGRKEQNGPSEGNDGESVSSSQYDVLNRKLKESREKIQALEKEVSDLRKENSSLRASKEGLIKAVTAVLQNY